MRRSFALFAALVAVLATVVAADATPVLAPRLADPGGSIARAARAATPEGAWYGMDGHLHTDHSHDAGLFHQTQGKRPETHDTTVREQLEEAARHGETFGTITDHRTYDGMYHPGFRSDSMVLIPGEEWGGYPHSTAWGLSEVLDQGPDEGWCGVARAVHEAHAQDALFGIAHPEDGRRPCIATGTLDRVPLDHLEVWRSPHDGFWISNVEADNRFAPSNGSDNHFRQLWGTEGGPGAMSFMVHAPAPTQAAFVEAVKAGRVFATGRAIGPTVMTLLDADRDGSFDAVTGGWAEPAGETVRVAFHVALGTGLYLQVYDDRGAMVAADPVAIDGPEGDVLAYDLPSGAAFYRAELTATNVARATGAVAHDYLSYGDTRRVLSNPVYLSAPRRVQDGTQSVPGGTLEHLSGDAAFAGFADVARDGDHVVAAWQQRRGFRYEVATRRSADGGATWSEAAVVSGPDEDARTPAVAVEGGRVVIAYEAHRADRFGGDIRVVDDASVRTYEGNNARPAVALDDGRVHLAFMSIGDDGAKIRYVGGSDRVLSSAAPWDGGLSTWTLPPSVVRHIPAALHPAIAADGGRVTVAWEDNREDPTPLRNGTPDDWGIFAASSPDGGATWTVDRRVSPKHDFKTYVPSDPEGYEGNPARHPDLAYAGGTLVLAYQDRYGGGSQVYIQSSDDLGASWSPPVRVSSSARAAEFSYKPQIVADGGSLSVVYQASRGATWNLRSATSLDGGATFQPEADVTSGSGFAGYPSAAGGLVVFTGERSGIYGVYAARP